MPLRKSHTPLEIPQMAFALAAPGAGPLPVTYIRQEQDNWCWAACCEMLLGFFNKPHVTQCTMASDQFGTSCCAHPDSDDCDVGCWPEDCYPRYGLDLDIEQGSIGQADLDQELGQRPVEVYYAWTKGGAHVALVTGRHSNGDYQVHDPWYGEGPRSLQQIRTGYGMGSWLITYKVRGA